jgi:hypothetical protein
VTGKKAKSCSSTPFPFPQVTAALAYDEGAKGRLGSKAQLNFPNGPPADLVPKKMSAKEMQRAEPGHLSKYYGG